MIWLWMIAALILSYLPLINKKIDISSYMWLLLPIDAYGLSIAGATIKPYMIFALILPLVLYAKNKGTDFDLKVTKGELFLGIISILIITVNLINCDSFSSAKASLMTLFVYICAQLYCSCADSNRFEKLSDVFIASCFGYGIIYITAYALLQSGLSFDSIVATERAEDGIFLTMSNMVNGRYVEAFRLRGFSFDPNIMFIQFIFGISACMSKLFKKITFYPIITIIISVVCILFSGSRMGLLCLFATILISSISCIIRFDSVKKKLLSVISTIILISGLLVAFMSRWGQSTINSLILNYSNRSSLTDEYGRFSIWRESLKLYWEKNPIFGIGYNNTSLYTQTERMTHNTWLQFICECGIIVGVIAVVYFLSVMIIGWAKVRPYHNSHPQSTAYLALIIGYTMTIISLISVDNITCSYLWFSALLVLKMSAPANSNNKISLKE